MQCTQCGTHNDDGAQICKSCGNALSGAAQAQPVQPPIPASPPPSYSGSASSSVKRQYLADVRRETAYPVFRGTINLIATLFYCLAAVIALAAVVGFLTSLAHSAGVGFMALIIGGISAAIIYYGATFWKEAALMLADIGDSITEVNSRK